MGRSLRSETFYGYARADEGQLFEDDDGEWQTVILRRRGIVDERTWDDYPDYGGHDRDVKYAAWKEANREADERWSAARKAVEEEFPIEVTWGGVEDYQIPCVAIKGSITTAHDAVTKLEGLPDAPFFADLARWNEELKRFFDAAGIDLTELDWNDELAWDGPAWFTAISCG